jgi:hypothetical protein
MNGRTDRAVLPQTHQDEFPAEYSLAGCSPAEPASASSATLILNQKPPVRLQNSSERQPSPKARVSKHRAGQESDPAQPQNPVGKSLLIQVLSIWSRKENNDGDLRFDRLQREIPRIAR